MMTKQEHIFVWKTIRSCEWLLLVVSALCFGFAFLFSDFFAWLILLFPIPLFLFFSLGRTRLSVFAYGFLWGLVAYGLHFFWFYILLREKSHAALPVAVGVYGIIICYAALTSGTWFVVMNWAQRCCAPLPCIAMLRILMQGTAFFLVSIFYFFILDHYMFWFLGTGYPFLNPLIALMRYGWFRVVFSGVLGVCGLVDSCTVPTVYHMPKLSRVKLVGANDELYKFLYLKPCSKDRSLACAQELLANLQALGLQTKSGAPRRTRYFVVGPETTFPFACNKHSAFVDLWARDLPENVSLLFGGVRLEDQKRYQTIYWIGQGLIMKAYDKTHRVPFVEKLPKFWKRSQWARSLFLEDEMLMSKGKNKENLFSVTKNFSIRPILCSELFFKEKSALVEGVSQQKTTLLLACVNDDWFCPYFRQILLLTARWRVSFLGKNLLFVGHK